MTTYVDSSALVPVYVPERFSKVAREVLRGVPQVPYTPLHELEVFNAFALLRGRGLITADEHRAIRTQLQEDVDAQRFVPVALDWAGVFAIARETVRGAYGQTADSEPGPHPRGCRSCHELSSVRLS